MDTATINAIADEIDKLWGFRPEDCEDDIEKAMCSLVNDITKYLRRKARMESEGVTEADLAEAAVTRESVGGGS